MTGRSGRRVRRDGLPAVILFLLAPFGALAFALGAHPAGLIDSGEEIRARVETWREPAAEAALRAGVPVDLLLALVATESSGRPGAVSPAGAVGLTQLLPGTARGEAARLGLPSPGTLDIAQPEVNLLLGARFLADQILTFDGDVALALAAYHSGPGLPARWRRASPGSSGLDLVRTHATPRTRAYVERVLERRAWFAESPSPR